jgi:hypothetical protein
MNIGELVAKATDTATVERAFVERAFGPSREHGSTTIIPWRGP